MNSGIAASFELDIPYDCLSDRLDSLGFGLFAGNENEGTESTPIAKNGLIPHSKHKPCRITREDVVV